MELPVSVDIKERQDRVSNNALSWNRKAHLPFNQPRLYIAS